MYGKNFVENCWTAPSKDFLRYITTNRWWWINFASFPQAWEFLPTYKDLSISFTFLLHKFTGTHWKFLLPSEKASLFRENLLWTWFSLNPSSLFHLLNVWETKNSDGVLRFLDVTSVLFLERVKVIWQLRKDRSRPKQHLNESGVWPSKPRCAGSESLEC